MLHIYRKGVLAMNEEIEFDGRFQIEEVRLHLDAVGGSSGGFLVQLDSGEGSEFDVVLNTQSMGAVADEIYQPTRPAAFRADDKLRVTWANGNAKTWGLEILYQLL